MAYDAFMQLLPVGQHKTALSPSDQALLSQQCTDFDADLIMQVDVKGKLPCQPHWTLCLTTWRQSWQQSPPESTRHPTRGHVRGNDKCTDQIGCCCWAMCSKEMQRQLNLQMACALLVPRCTA